MTRGQATESATSPRLVDQSAPLGFLVPPASPWSVIALPAPWTSGPSAALRPSTPSAPDSTFPPTPPWSSVPPASPQSSGSTSDVRRCGSSLVSTFISVVWSLWLRLGLHFHQLHLNLSSLMALSSFDSAVGLRPAPSLPP
ncbi:hypothetical protein PO909_021801 [Leuciscus waleckii]